MERRRTVTEESVRQRLSEDLRRVASLYEEAVARVRRARAVSGILLGAEAQRVLDDFNAAAIEASESAYGAPYRETLASLIERASELLVRAAETDLLGLQGAGEDAR